MVRSRRETGGVVAAYKTIAAPAEAEIVEKKSRFIGQIAPVSTEEEALAFIAEVKATHRMARHNVYAYVLRGGRVRYTDDGEPAKTAGMPTLEAIQHAGLEDVAVVVTRYFGGILLGTGGLVRAYTYATKAAIEAADIVTVCLRRHRSGSSLRSVRAAVPGGRGLRREACRERLRRERPAHLPHARRHPGLLPGKAHRAHPRPK